ncbi:MAG: YggT family protein [Rhodobacteraceae bacterium]|nr:YggT family protein [Paracoccaceae bacterium]
MVLIINLIYLLLDILWWVVIAHALMSWLISMNVFDPNNQFIRNLWGFLERILYPIYSKIRPYLPNTGAIDLSPLVLIVGIIVVRQLLANLFLMS